MFLGEYLEILLKNKSHTKFIFKFILFLSTSNITSLSQRNLEMRQMISPKLCNFRDLIIF